MAWYNYICLDCRDKAVAVKGSELTQDELAAEVVYETAHAMEPTKKELKEALICPRCLGGRAERTYIGHNVICYVRGNGYLDKAGCHRDMNLHKLTGTDPDTGMPTDPYHEMREPGEAEDLKLRLQRGGNYNPRPRYFQGPGGSSEGGGLIDPTGGSDQSAPPSSPPASGGGEATS